MRPGHVKPHGLAALLLASWAVQSTPTAARAATLERGAVPRAIPRTVAAEPAALPAAPENAAPAPAAQEEASGPVENLMPLLANLRHKLPGGKPDKFPVGISFLLDTSAGNGSFVLHEHARQPYLANTLRITPSLTIWRSLKASMRLILSKEWVASYSQSTTVPNQLVLEDLWMGLGMKEIYREPVTGLGFGANVTTFAPISVQSRAETLVLGVRPAAWVNWQKWGFDVGYTLMVRKNFHQYANPTADARRGTYECGLEGRCFVDTVSSGNAERREVEEDKPIRLPDGRMLDPSRRNVSHSVSHVVEGSWTPFFAEALTFSGSLVLINTFRYPLKRNSLSSDWSMNEWGQTDTTWGTLDVSYSPWQRLSFDVGVSSLQPFWSGHRGTGIAGWTNNGTVQGDGKLVPNFPFFDATTPGNNFTTFFFDVIVTI